MRNIGRIFGGMVVAILLLVGMAIPAYATTNAPDTLSIDSIEVYRHAGGELNSQVVIVPFTCEYTTSNSTYDIDQAFIFVLKNTATGVTIATTTAYAYPTDGYNIGLVSFEFTASAPLTWSGNYTLTMYGNPTIAWTGGIAPSDSSDVITWLDEGKVSNAQTRLTTRLRYLANKYETNWGVDLIESQASKMILTQNGEEYFTNSIDNLRDICPDLFPQTMQAVEYPLDIMVTDMLSSGADADVLVNNTDYCAQTFTPSESYSITGMNMPAYRVLIPATLTVSLRATVAGLPSGADLVVGTYDTTNMTTATTGEWINVAFTSDYDLTAGVVYALVAITSAAPGNEVRWLADTGNGYANGQECVFVAGWAAVPANDLLFEIEARNAVTMGLAARIEDRLVGTQFDFTNWANSFGLSRIWWSTIFWVAISAVIMVAAAFGSNSWDCSMVVLIMMLSYGWRGGWVDTIVFALIVALLSGGLVYAVFWKKT